MKSFITFNKIIFKKGQNGVALLMALFFVVVMTFLATSVSYDTLIEYSVSSQSVNRLRAYYAAKSGTELSLLRVLIYQKALAVLPKELEEQKSMLDPIWQFPFAWPPTAFLPEDMSKVERGLIAKLEEESIMEGQYVTTIEDEAGRIDINDLGSSSEKIREATRKQILKIFEIELENNDDFNDKYSSFEFEKLVNNIQDWVDEDKESKNGGDEKSNYQDIISNFGNSNADFLPPNQSFKSIEELHMIPEMTDEIFNMLKTRVTIYGVKGININSAEKDVLKSLDSQITDEIADKILERIANKEKGGPFKNNDDFVGFLQGENLSTDSFNEDGIPLLYGSEHNFVIKSTGSFAGVTKEITAITFDLESLKARYVTLLEEEDKEKSGGGTGTGTGTGSGSTQSQTTQTKAKKKTPSGRPTIVFWREN